MNRQLDMFQGRIERDKGIQQAEDHANAVVPNWSEDCLKLFRVWLDHLQAGSFQMEDFRSYALTAMEAPAHLRAFGAIAVKAQKLGWIARVGAAPVDDPGSHRAISNVWKKLR